MSSVSKKYKTTIVKLLALESSIKEKYDTLFSLDCKHLKNTQQYKGIIQEIKGLKHFEKELLKELPTNYYELEQIIKELKQLYLPSADNDLNLMVPRTFPYSPYTATRLVNKLVYYIVSNFEKILLKPLIAKSQNIDEEKLKDANNAAFVTAYNNYLRQDIINIQIIINYANTNSFIKTQLKRNFYDLCYALPHLEEKYLSKNFEITPEYTITSDIIPSFYGLSADKFKLIQDKVITELCLKEIKFMSSQNLYELEPNRNLFTTYFSQSLIQASLLIASSDIFEQISYIVESQLEDNPTYETVKQMIGDIFTNVENSNISLSRVQFKI